jgi:hypothetical protein
MEIVEGRITSGLVRMRIGYCTNQKLRKYKISKDIFLNTRFHAGLFRECVDGKENAVINLQNDLCKTLGSETDVNKRVAEWDPVSQTCKFNGNVPCPSGEMVDGIGSDGRVNCKKIVNNDSDVQTLINYTNVPADCSNGESLKLEWDNINKQFKMVCQ